MSRVTCRVWGLGEGGGPGFRSLCLSSVCAVLVAGLKAWLPVVDGSVSSESRPLLEATCLLTLSLGSPAAGAHRSRLSGKG